MSEVAQRDTSVRVALVENDAETLETWVRLLAGHPRIKCVAACKSGEAGVRQIPGCRPDVILMDIRLTGMSGIRCASLLKQVLPKTQILMLTAFSQDRYIFEALKAGASGYLLKSVSPEALVAAILDAAEGGAPMTGQIARRVIEVFRSPPLRRAPDGEQLTSREGETLELLARGYQNKEIAQALECTVGTVRTHVQHIYEKLHVHCRTEAAAKYLGDPSPTLRE